MAEKIVEMQGEELNRRLEDLALKVERVSLLIEDAMVDPNDVIGLDSAAYNNLMICLAKYEEFLSHLHDTTMDATEDIRNIVGSNSECYGEIDEDSDEEYVNEEEEKPE